MTHAWFTKSKQPAVRQCSLVNVKSDDLVIGVDLSHEPSRQRGPLQHEGSDQKVVPDAAVAVALEERHQESKADEHHHVNVHHH